MRSDQMHLRVLCQASLQQIWKLMAILQSSAHWKKGNFTPIFKRGDKKDLGSCRMVNLSSVPGKIMEQILMETMLKPIQEKEVTQDSQHDFTKVKSFLTNLVALCDTVTAMVNKGRSLDVIYRGSVSPPRWSRMTSLSANWRHEFWGWTIQWIGNCLDGRTQRVLVSGPGEGRWWVVSLRSLSWDWCSSISSSVKQTMGSDGTQLSDAVGTIEEWDTSQGHLEKLE